MNILIAIIAAAVLFLIITALLSVMNRQREESREAIQMRLRSLAMSDTAAESISIVAHKRSMSEMKWLERILKKFSWVEQFDTAIKQGQSSGAVGTYLLTAGLIGLVSAYIIYMVIEMMIPSIGLGALLGSIPIMRVYSRRRKRMDAFQKQLPDALELLGRALRAGHTFGGGMRMVADEFEDPIGGEFKTTLDEINFGMDVDRALANLLARVDCDDLKFFIVSVNIQRETGGNLAEIINKIAGLVRERFELFGRVNVLAAEGKVSAMILTALPFIIFIVIWLINPEYMSRLYTTDTGRTFAVAGICSMIVGILIIRKMIRIKV
ncbi:MAG: type II secretion system F family protein [Desulfovibrio sp.]